MMPRLVLKAPLPMWNMLGEGRVSGHGSSAKLMITVMLVMFNNCLCLSFTIWLTASTEKQIYWPANRFLECHV